MSKLQLLRAIVANTKRRGKDRLLFNPKYLQDEDKSQRKRVQGWSSFLKRFESRVTCFPSYPENPQIKSQDAASRRKRPDGRTRGGHAPKRVASLHTLAAETRPKPRFRGIPVLSGEQFSWRNSIWTLLPSAPINTPADATERVYRKYRAKS